jgi:hypothetical protein
VRSALRRIAVIPDGDVALVVAFGSVHDGSENRASAGSSVSITRGSGALYPADITESFGSVAHHVACCRSARCGDAVLAGQVGLGSGPDSTRCPRWLTTESTTARAVPNLMGASACDLAGITGGMGVCRTSRPSTCGGRLQAERNSSRPSSDTDSRRRTRLLGRLCYESHEVKLDDGRQRQ